MSTRDFSSRQEKKLHKMAPKELGMKLTPNSGATAFKKGDLLGKHCLIDAKTTTTQKKSYSIKRDELIKIQWEAFAMGKDIPVLAFDFGDNGQQYAVIRMEDFYSLLQFMIDIFE